MNINPNAIPTFLAAFALFYLYIQFAKRISSRGGRIALFGLALILAIPGILFVVYYAHLFDNAAWFYRFRAFPHSEIAAFGLGAIAGFLQARFQPSANAEKIVIPVVLTVLLFVPFMKSTLNPVDYRHLNSTCPGEVCLQSTPSTCGPNSAATLLKQFGHYSSERELAQESYTYRGGTEVWYLARALSRRGFTTQFVVQERDRISPPVPSIAGVVLRGGAGHFIAIMQENPNDVTIGDPLVGKVVVPKSNLKDTYHFTGFFLVIRPIAP